MDQAERDAARTGHDRCSTYTAITHTYRHATSGDVETLNTRRSLTPASAHVQADPESKGSLK
jgi:hypothetical protein